MALEALFSNVYSTWEVEICTSAKKHDTYAKRSFFTRDETTLNGDEMLSEVAYLFYSHLLLDVIFLHFFHNENSSLV